MVHLTRLPEQLSDRMTLNHKGLLYCRGGFGKSRLDMSNWDKLQTGELLQLTAESTNEFLGKT